MSKIKTLREIAFMPDVFQPPVPQRTDLEVKRFVKRFIVDQFALEHLYLSTRGHLEAICNAIHDGLFMTKKRNRKQLEIALDVDVRELTDTEEFLCNISRIISGLALSDIDKWILCVDAVHTTEQQHFDWAPMKSGIISLLGSQPGMQLVKKTDIGFVIAKRGHLMSRHEQWWHKGLRILHH